MATLFLEKVPRIKKYSLNIALPLGIALIIIGNFFSLGLILLGIILTIFAITAQCIWVVPTGNVGYVEIFQKIKDKTYLPGLNWYIPVITDRYLMDTRVIKIIRVDRKKVISGTDIIFQESFNYQLKPSMVNKVFSLLGENYWETVEKWVDHALDDVTSKYSYAEIRADQEGFKKILVESIKSAVEIKCREITAQLQPRLELVEISELKPAFELVPDPADPSSFIQVPKKIEIEESGKTELVQAKELVKTSVSLSGMNLFQIMTLTINDIRYPEEYQKSRDELVKARVEVEVAKETAKKLETLAEGKKKAKELEAEAEANAIRAKGEAENEILTKRGEILDSNPKLISEQVAKNYPKVVGGTMPTLSVDKIVE